MSPDPDAPQSKADSMDSKIPPEESYYFPRVCGECEYDMTGIEPDQPCPECGGVRRVIPAEPPASLLAKRLILFSVLALVMCGPLVLFAIPFTSIIAVRLWTETRQAEGDPARRSMVIGAFVLWGFSIAVSAVWYSVIGSMLF